MIRRLALLLLPACGPGPTDAPVAFPPADFEVPGGFWSYTGPPRLLVTEADAVFEVGTYGVVDLDAEAWIREGDHAHGDAVPGCAGDWLLVINRMNADNLQFVDPHDGATVAQWSTGNGTNPQAAVFWGDEAWVSLYEEDHLLVARWHDGAVRHRLDLSPWADADGVPEAGHLFVHGGLIWVSLERMDREGDWVPAGGSRLLAVDPAAREVVAEVVLPLENPTGGWTVEGDLAWSVAAGALREGTSLALDGGLVRVDLPRAAAEAVAPHEADVGRDLRAGRVQGDQAWFSTYDEALVNHLERWDLATGTRVQEVAEGFFTGWAAGPEGDLWIADHAGTLDRRSWWDGAILATLPTALYPSGVAACIPEE